jgi:D-aminopeptidase
VPLGRLLPPDANEEPPLPEGSCIGVAVTDAPVDGAGCARLARRIGLGLARAGSTASNGSGEIFVAAATGLRATRRGALSGVALGGADLNPLFAAVVEASEEAVLNSISASPTMTGKNGHTVEGVPVDAVRSLVQQASAARQPWSG